MWSGLKINPRIQILPQQDEAKPLFSFQNFWNFDTVALSFVLGNYYPIMG